MTPTASPAGVGFSGTSFHLPSLPPEDFDELFAQIPPMDESEASIPASAGPGTQPLDYADRDQALFAVAIVRDLPPGMNRAQLIRQYGFTKEEIQGMRQQYAAILSARGQAPSPFPQIQWAPSPIQPLNASTPIQQVTSPVRPVTASTPNVRRRLMPPPTPPPQSFSSRVPSDPSDPSSSSSSSSSSSDPSTPSSRGSQLLDRFDDVTDQVRRAARGPGRRVRNITHTNTVTTVYEEDPNGTPLVRRTSTRNGPGRRSRNSTQSGSGWF